MAKFKIFTEKPLRQHVLIIYVISMHITKVADHIYLVDVEAGGIKNFIASYVVKGEKVAIIETGPTLSTSNLLLGLKELNIAPEEVAYVVVSHIHLDHSGGTGSLLKHLPKAKVIVHQRGAPHLTNPEKLWEQSKMVLGSITDIYGKPEPVHTERIFATSDGDEIDLGEGIALKVIETTGHASHHQSYYEASSKAVFPGDAAGIYLCEIGVVVPTTPAPFRMDIALASIERLKQLKPKLLLYSHFGRAYYAEAKLQTYMDQLRLWARIAYDGLKEGQQLEVISKRIIDADESIQKALKYIGVHTILSKTVFEQSIHGVVDFVQKFGLSSV
ncbi:MBL fold metallo-hydrolase [Candidatus Bathyarchaeota archaeon]|nr:MBL fold metallo-hydrolase [Candidatus Bathyarchaeota archaeon]